MGKYRGEAEVTNSKGTTFTRTQMLGSDKEDPQSAARTGNRGVAASNAKDVTGIPVSSVLAPDDTKAALVASAVPDDVWQSPTFNPVSTSTPWGEAQYSRSFDRGLTEYATASHGGFIVSKTLASQMPESLRSMGNPTGRGLAFEEDQAWRAVAATFPDRFPQSSVENAVDGLKNHSPHVWQEFSGETLDLSESVQLREEAFLAEAEGSYVNGTVFSKDDGMVEVRFRRLVDGNDDYLDEKSVFMPRDEYRERQAASSEATGGATSRFQFDPSRDEARTHVVNIDIRNREEAAAWLTANPQALRFKEAFYPLKGGKRVCQIETADGLAGYVVRSKKDGHIPAVGFNPLSEVLYDEDRDGPLMSSADVSSRFGLPVPAARPDLGRDTPNPSS